MMGEGRCHVTLVTVLVMVMATALLSHAAIITLQTSDTETDLLASETETDLLASDTETDQQNETRDLTEPNLKPVIGILAQELPRTMDKVTGRKYSSYIAASYVKFIESGGARVVPIMIHQTEDYYKGLINILSGVVFPGGSASFKSSTNGYGKAGRILYNLIKEAKMNEGQEIPLMAVCLGFEMLLYLEAGENPLTRCDASGVADPLFLKPGWNETELLGKAPAEVIKTLTTTKSTSNYHKYCVTPQTFMDLGLNNTYTLVSTSNDRKGLEYISTVEHRTMPIFGTQWHPEKNIFEWAYRSIPHFYEAVKSSQYIGNAFVQKARLNSHYYKNSDEENYPLIYSSKPTYIRKLYKSSFHQVYLYK